MSGNCFRGRNIPEVCDLTFNEQVLIWALRMKVRGKQYFEKVAAHCEKNLPPAAARIALNSIEKVVSSVKHHGKKSLRLNCTCMPELSSDEFELIILYRSINNEQNQIDAPIVFGMVSNEGTELLVNGLLSFHMAMETINSIDSKQTDRLLVARQRQSVVWGATSKMVH